MESVRAVQQRAPRARTHLSAPPSTGSTSCNRAASGGGGGGRRAGGRRAGSDGKGGGRVGPRQCEAASQRPCAALCPRLPCVEACGGQARGRAGADAHLLRAPSCGLARPCLQRPGSTSWPRGALGQWRARLPPPLPAAKKGRRLAALARACFKQCRLLIADATDANGCTALDWLPPQTRVQSPPSAISQSSLTSFCLACLCTTTTSSSSSSSSSPLAPRFITAVEGSARGLEFDAGWHRAPYHDLEQCLSNSDNAYGLRARWQWLPNRSVYPQNTHGQATG